MGVPTSLRCLRYSNVRLDRFTHLTLSPLVHVQLTLPPITHACNALSNISLGFGGTLLKTGFSVTMLIYKTCEKGWGASLVIF